jgi:CheY-like chemotaxis protein
MLEALGCQVTVVTNGQEAVEVCAHTTYDLVLMDCQMPTMDGYEATRAIRKRENGYHAPRSTPQKTPSRIPIIALTAHALEEDRAQCLAAGMDDYLSKPFTQDQLRTLLTRWLPKSPKHAEENAPQEAGNHTTPQPLMSQPSPVEHKVLHDLRAVLGDRIHQVIHTFLQNTPILLQTLRKAVAGGDIQTMTRTAHSLKGTTSTLGMLALSGLCKEVEFKGRANSLDDVDQLLTAVHAEYERVQVALTTEFPESS